MIPATDFSTLPSGYAFPAQQFVLDRAHVDRYLQATEDTSPAYAGEDALVPPLALIAFAMRELADLIAAHPGSIHFSQHLRVLRPARVGMAMHVEWSVKGRSERRGFAALTLQVRVLEQREDGEGAAATELLPAAEEPLLMEGSLVLMVPLAKEQGDG
jgi:hypothetical protein